MPEILRFLGIIIFMLYNDHRPPHFHASYGDYTVSVEIGSGVIEGRFPRRALDAVIEWYTINKDELMNNWQLAEEHYPLKMIPPLE